MIFRKFSDTPARPTSTTASVSKTPMTPQRAEPVLAARPPVASLSVTPPAAPLPANAPRRNPSTPPNRNEQTRKLTVGRDISLNGEIATCDHLIVEGTVQATIKGGKVLDIAECGSYRGTVEIDQADIAGMFDGELTVKGKLVIRSSARVTGTLRYAQLQVDTGARINGTLQSVAAQTPKIPDHFEEHTQFETTLPQQQGFGLSALNDASGFLKATA